MSRSKRLSLVVIVSVLLSSECAAIYVVVHLVRTQRQSDAALAATRPPSKDKPDPKEARDALLRLFGGAELPLRRFQDEHPLRTAADVKFIGDSIRDDMRTLRSKEIGLELGGVLRIGDWRWREDGSAFDELFRLPGGRRFRLRGRFVRSKGGRWEAEVTRLVRLLPRAEASSTQSDDEDLKKVVELTLTPVEARAALTRWLQRLDRPDAAQEVVDFGGPGYSTALLQYLQSNECRAELANAAITEAESRYTIDGWDIYPDDLIFLKRKPVGADDLVGQLEPTSNWEWRIVLDMMVFDLGYTKGR
jgi:hypothetical protein